MGFSNDNPDEVIYRRAMNYEDQVLTPKIRELSIWRDTDQKLYQSGVYTLALFLPEYLRNKALKFIADKKPKADLTMDGKLDHDDIIVYELLIMEHSGMCVPKVRYHEGKL